MIYKPKSCKDCEVVIKEKTKLICGVYKKNRANIDDEEDLEKMYNNCVLEWDEKEF